ncbi:MAG: 4-alpha-glucanotransferase [Acidobacteriota bacterium]
MSFSRSSGILLHPTSLPSRFGIGDLGEEAYKFINFLSLSGQRLWQVLPLGPIGYGNSPYQCFSAFAGNTLLISPKKLWEDGLLSSADIKNAPKFNSESVDYGAVINYKRTLLHKAYENFKRKNDSQMQAEFDAFCQESAAWLNDYAFFSVLKEAHKGVAWIDWQPHLSKYDTSVLIGVHQRMRDAVSESKFSQYLFFKQWLALKTFCQAHDIKLIGDLPIFVAYDSADVWQNPHLFKLDSENLPVVVAGVPPDFFSKTGQRWGNPIYNWEAMRNTGFAWWIERMRTMLRLFDIVRVDHFRGFAACWEVPASEETAENGEWVEVPGRDLFTTLKAVLGEMPIIAEDLGLITPDVVELREEFGFPGMRILQFAFDSDSSNSFLPHNYVRNTVVYTGTHDNDTTVGWFKNASTSAKTSDSVSAELEYCLKYLNSDGKEIHWDFIRAALASVANMAIIPLQDILGFDSSARMNLPSSRDGNWGWRFSAQLLTEEIVARLKSLSEIYGRISANT